jgi:hypothetical protein
MYFVRHSIRPKHSYVFDRQPIDDDLDVRENETLEEVSIGRFFKKFGWKGALPPILLGIGINFWRGITYMQISPQKLDDQSWSWLKKINWLSYSGNSRILDSSGKSRFVYTISCFGSLIATGVVNLFNCRNRVRNFTVLYSVLMVIGISEFVLFKNTGPWYLSFLNFVVGFSDS